MPDKSEFKRSPLQVAIDASIAKATGHLQDELAAAAMRIRKLEDQAEDAGAAGGKDLDRKMNEWAKENMPELVMRTLLQQLVAPAGAAPSRRLARSAGVAGEPDGCRHKNNMKACASCRAKKAA